MNVRVWAVMGLVLSSTVWGCAGEVTAPGTGGAGTTVSTGGSGGSDCDPECIDDWPVDCADCACGVMVSEGGCLEVCDVDYDPNGGALNLCNGGAANSACAQCVLDNCGEPDPLNCGP